MRVHSPEEWEALEKRTAARVHDSWAAIVLTLLLVGWCLLASRLVYHHFGR